MAYDEELARRVRRTLGDRDGLTERKMFGGLAFMIHGNMCCGVLGDELVVRVGSEAYEAALSEPQAREMDFTGRPMRGMVMVGADGLETGDLLESWIARGAAFAESLPPK